MGKIAISWFTIKIFPEFLNCFIQVTINTCKLEGIFTNKNKKTELQEEIKCWNTKQEPNANKIKWKLKCWSADF